jgi:uncharacterized protein YeaO (DUF488 family)
MTLWTSYYGNMRNIPKDYFLVATSGAVPDEILAHVDSWNQKLAPSKDIFIEYKQTRDWDRYVERFKEERLTHIDWLEMLCKWEDKANENGKTLDNIVLLCYEQPIESCHRFILAESVENEFKTKVLEYGFEKYDRINYRLNEPISTDFLF